MNKKLFRFLNFMFIILFILFIFNYAEVWMHEETHVRICEEDGGTGKVISVSAFSGSMVCSDFKGEIGNRDILDLQLEIVSFALVILLNFLIIYPLYWRVIKEI